MKCPTHIVSGVMLAVPLLIASQPATAQSMTDCEGLKDNRKRAECFQAVAKKLSEAKRKNDEIDSFVKKAKGEATRSFLDPDSANFRNLLVTVDKSGRTLCGEVNAKNRMGGYVGYRRFIAPFKTEEQVFSSTLLEAPDPQTGIEKARADMFNISWDLYCVSFPTVWRE